MKLYERIENNNFDEMDRNRAIELIEGGNGHLVYNENYFKLQKENEELKNAVNIVNKEKSDWTRAYQEEKDKQFELLRSSIPVKEVKDKIEELKEQYNVRELDFIKTTQDIRKIIIQSLEELLEVRKLEEDKL